MAITTHDHDSRLAYAIHDMTTNPWQASPSTVERHGGPVEAYNAQRKTWIKHLASQDPESAEVFAAHYPARIGGALTEQTTKREDILRTASKLIHGDREQDYGRPIDSFRRVAAAFNLVLEGAGHPPIDPVTAAKLMIALKLSRLAGGDNKDDTWVDLAGYSALGAEVRDQQ